MTKNQLYEDYFKKITSIKDPSRLSEDKVDELLKELIVCLPNNALLDKYRSINVDDKNSIKHKVLKSAK